MDFSISNQVRKQTEQNYGCFSQANHCFNVAALSIHKNKMEISEQNTFMASSGARLPLTSKSSEDSPEIHKCMKHPKLAPLKLVFERLNTINNKKQLRKSWFNCTCRNRRPEHGSVDINQLVTRIKSYLNHYRVYCNSGK